MAAPSVFEGLEGSLTLVAGLLEVDPELRLEKPQSILEVQGSLGAN